MNDYYKILANLLIHLKRFDKEVKKARIMLDIPEDGFKNEDDAIRWVRSIKPDMKCIFSTEKPIVPLVKPHNIPPNKKILKTLSDLTNKFNLDEKWSFGFFEYLISSDRGLQYPTQSIEVKAHIQSDDSSVFSTAKGEVVGITIEIGKDASLSDIKKVWKKVQVYQTRMKSIAPQRKKPISIDNIEKFVKVRELEQQGLTHRQIVRQHPELGFVTYSHVAIFKRDIQKSLKPSKHKK